MITGAHTILYSTDPEADKAFLRDVLKLSNIDAGNGWLIFGLPPSEIAVHPGDSNEGKIELFLMCDNIEGFVKEMVTKNIGCEPIQKQRWGSLTYLRIPGGAKIGVYEPHHPRPDPMPNSLKS